MKSITICILFAFLSISAYAQQYWVYSVTGDVKIDNKIARPKQLVYGNQKVEIPLNSQVSLFDNEKKYLYHLTSKGSFTIEDLVGKQKPSVKRLSNNYLTYVVNNIFGKKATGAPAMGERGENEDLLFLSTLIQHLNPGQTPLGKSIYDNYSKLPTDFSVKCEFFDYNSENKLVPLSKSANVNCYPIVTNYSGKDLYVSIIVVSQDGNIDLYFHGNASQYIVPAESTISFRKYYRHWEKNNNEKVLLFATEYPIDISKLLSINTKDQLAGQTNEKLKIGVVVVE